MIYISRDKAIAYVEEQYRLFKNDESKQAVVEGCVEALKFVPLADVQEVKHGEWIPVQYTYFGLKRYECSKCKDDEYWQKRYLEHKEKYCPNCGAKMDGERRDT